VLPRELAFAVTVRAYSRAGWAVGIAILVLTVPGLVLVMVSRGKADALVLPLAALCVMLAALVELARHPSTRMVVGYLLIGTLCFFVYVWSLLVADPTVQQDALLIVNRPGLALVLVGTATASPLAAMGGAIIGFVLAEAALVIASISVGLVPLTGSGPALTLANFCAGVAGLMLVQRAQRGHLPDVVGMQEETQRLREQRDRDRRTTALIHDTVLNDLVLVMNTPDQLDERTRSHLRQDLQTLSDADVADVSDRDHHLESGAEHFRSALIGIASHYQWRGLNVDVTVDLPPHTELRLVVSEAALSAVRGCLENVVRHSGVHSAEIVVSGSPERVTVMVVDGGVGFSPKAIPDDRLGLRTAVVQRVELVGGSVKVWSAPGRGTSVLISLPAVPSNTLAKVADA
jgi:signal transduction histidine kinase